VAGYRGRPRHFNLADMFELVAAAVPVRDAVVSGERRCTFRELDLRANRVANLLLSWALPPRTRVAILSSNRIECVEVMLGAFKARATPICLRLDGTAEEARDVLDGVAAQVLVYETRFSPIVSAVAGQVPSLRHLLTLGDSRRDHRTAVGATDYEVALAVRSEAVPGLDRSPDDLYMVYDPRAEDGAGTPAAASWRHEDLFFAELGGGRQDSASAPVASPADLVDRLTTAGTGPVDRVSAPLGEAATQRRLLSTLLAGGTVVLSGDAGPPAGTATAGGGSDAGAEQRAL
jgi:acyl-CoA synthetase (AMP-forming)/AMP-acid ligase II